MIKKGMISIMNKSDRSYFNFEEKVRRAFSFLTDLDFNEVEALPTLVRYRKDGVEVDVYHGRQSYEIGAGVSAFGTRYAISEIIRAVNPDAAKQFRYVTTSTSEGIILGLEKLSSLMKHYGREALEGNSKFFSKLEKQRQLWVEEYSLDVLAEQLRPQAEEAFRRKDYSKAADLYSRIKKCLSPAEIKKLNVAEKRRKKGGGKY